jgi:hypothetical protein
VAGGLPPPRLARGGRRFESRARAVEMPLLQHAAGALPEAGEKEGLGQRIARVRRRPQMKIRDPVLGAQIFEIEPYRRALARRHRGDVDRRQFTAERLDHDVGHFERVARMGRLVPVLDDDAAHRLASALQRQRRAQLLKRMQVVDEHAHLPAVLARELARKSPAHADVAEIVDHRAEDIAGDRRGRVRGVAGKGRGGRHGGLERGFERMDRVARFGLSGRTAPRCRQLPPTPGLIRGNRVRTRVECSKLAILKHPFTIARVRHTPVSHARGTRGKASQHRPTQPILHD